MARVLGAWANLSFNPATWKEDTQARRDRFARLTPIEPPPTTVVKRTLVPPPQHRQEPAVAPDITSHVLPKLKRTPENLVLKMSEEFRVLPADITTKARGISYAGLARSLTCLLMRDLIGLTPREIAPIMGYSEEGYQSVYLHITNMKQKLGADRLLTQRVDKVISAFE